MTILSTVAAIIIAYIVIQLFDPAITRAKIAIWDWLEDYWTYIIFWIIVTPIGLWIAWWLHKTHGWWTD